MALRKIKALSMPDVEPAAPQNWKPALRWVEPSALMVDEAYQRNLSERSVTLIRKIVARWDWASFKPPVVVEADKGLHVVDGQHTAIAAASHGGIDKIPVFVVRAEETAARASAFVAHNRDRIAMTPLALHHAMLAAGDEDALTIAQVCARAGVTLLKAPPWDGVFKPGQTTAIGSLRTLVRRRHAAGARRVLDICAAARLAPLSADHIKAVDALLFHPDFDGADPARVSAALIEHGPEALKRAAQMAAAKGWPRWRALAIVLNTHARARAA